MEAKYILINHDRIFLRDTDDSEPVTRELAKKKTYTESKQKAVHNRNKITNQSEWSNIYLPIFHPEETWYST